MFIYLTVENSIMPISLEEKKSMLAHLLDQYKISSDTKMVLFAHADLKLPGADTIDEEVLLALSGYLEQHKKENPCLVTTPRQLQEVLEVLAANSPHSIKLVALGHYCAGLETVNAYKFVNSIAVSDYLDDFVDHLYFATILNNYEFISKFRALGCITARFKENPDYKKTNLLGKFNDEGKPDIKTTVRTDGEVTELLDENSLLYQIAINLKRKNSICLKGEVQPMFPTVSGKIVAAKSMTVMHKDIQLVDPEKLEMMYAEIAREATIYPKSITFMWPREAEYWRPKRSAESSKAVVSPVIAAKEIEIQLGSSKPTFFHNEAADAQQSGESKSQLSSVDNVVKKKEGCSGPQP